MHNLFDETLEAAWGRFEANLVARLESLGDAVFVLEVECEDPAGGAPYGQFAGSGDVLRGKASSNRFLAPGNKLSRRDHQALRALGWAAPGRGVHTSNWRVELGVDLAELLAGMAVSTLRQVFGVISPEFMVGEPGAERRWRRSSTSPSACLSPTTSSSRWSGGSCATAGRTTAWSLTAMVTCSCPVRPDASGRGRDETCRP